ncbi:MAG: NPCBM/NEW2 domain-containing protein [Planctomycetes bacterium]|nr:NPCBM/NEW2 domain-containing protein [Planctomycetota bacterium]MCW8134618.1 NPCBM/NEW2 domain-containing protein [Planctomycetota bacterium]
MTRLLVCLIALAPALLAQATVTSIFQKPAVGTIQKLDQQGRLEVKVAGSDVPARVPLDEVEEVTFGHKGDERKPEDAPLRVYLVNGDLLHGTADNGPEDDEEVFVLRGKRFGELQINIEAVKRIEVVANVAPNLLPELAPDAKFDHAYLVEQLDPSAAMQRIVKDGVYLYNRIIDGDNVEGVKYAWERIRGVVCKRTVPAPFTKLEGIFTLRDGSMLRGAIKSWAGGKVTFEHRTLKRDVTLEESNLISVTMKNGRYIYLSDMEFAEPPDERPWLLPPDFKYEEYLFKARRDQANLGGPISLRGKVYAKGLGVHAISRLSFDLNRGYTRFVADIGVDDSAGDLASVEFKVYADGKLVFESGVLRRSAEVRTIDLEVLNVRRIVLEVTATDDGDSQDRANWANAKLVR